LFDSAAAVMASAKATFASFACRDGDNPAQVLLKVNPPNTPERLPADVCVVVDVSGSMQQEATIKTGIARESEAPPLSVLDIVKHALKTLIHTMRAGDHLGIVAYSDYATIVLPLTEMSEAGQGLAAVAAESLNASGRTNMWDGLLSGLTMHAENPQRFAMRSSSLMLLTDGVPDEPAGGLRAALETYRIEQGGKLPCTVHTFGFGKELDSRLLNSLAHTGDGMYVFIPDASFVGTALVNCTSNSLVTMGRNAVLSLEPCAGCEISECIGHSVDSGSGYKIALGSLQFGQSRDAVVYVRAPAGHTGPFVNATLAYDLAGQVEQVTADTSKQIVSADASQVAEIRAQELRLRFADLARQIVSSVGANGSDLALARPMIDSFVAKLTGDDPRIAGLREDIEGQVREATSRQDWYNGWGAHYLQSLARAHLIQQCNNFKDPGVQLYGGDLFQDVRDFADETFLKLPPPQVTDTAGIDMLQNMGFPADQARQALAAAHDDVELAAQYCMEGIPARPPPPQRAAPTGRPAPAYDMRDFHNPAGACFSGVSRIALPGGAEKELRKLKKGDCVLTENGMTAKVVCVVETCTKGGQSQLVDVSNGLQATLWHPVRLNDKWVFPAKACPDKVVTQDCKAVYNLVLDGGHVICIGGVWTVSLGHQLQDDVVRHPYWGGEAVLEDLRRLRGWKQGKVTLGPNCVVRDASGQVVGLKQESS